MILSFPDLLCFLSAIVGIFMAGSSYLRVNLSFYSFQTACIAVITAWLAYVTGEPGLYVIACAIVIMKALVIPAFLAWIIGRIEIHSDSGTFMTAPLAMHLSIVFLGLSYLFTRGLPTPAGAHQGWPGATAAISLLLTGLVLMLTRKVALSQIIGFLVIENGIYLFAITQTHGMPLIVEMGMLLDLLAAVMIAGLLIFRIKRSFEHIDVSQLAELKD